MPVTPEATGLRNNTTSRKILCWCWRCEKIPSLHLHHMHHMYIKVQASKQLTQIASLFKPSCWVGNCRSGVNETWQDDIRPLLQQFLHLANRKGTHRTLLVVCAWSAPTRATARAKTASRTRTVPKTSLGDFFSKLKKKRPNGLDRELEDWTALHRSILNSVSAIRSLAFTVSCRCTHSKSCTSMANCPRLGRNWKNGRDWCENGRIGGPKLTVLS